MACEPELVERIVKSGIGTFAISIDGRRETHDFIRTKDSYKRSMNLIQEVVKRKVYTTVITTISQSNIDELEEVYHILSKFGVSAWQIQIGIPMGNMKSQIEKVIHPEQIEDILNFIDEKNSARIYNLR